MASVLVCNEPILSSSVSSENKGRSGVIVSDILDIEQAYFWTSQWQEWEREAEKNLEAGRYAEFADFESLLKDLDQD